MPCTDGGPGPGQSDYERLNRATAAACEMRKLLPKGAKLSSATLAWMHEHDAEDEARVQREKQAKKDELARAKRLRAEAARLEKENR